MKLSVSVPDELWQAARDARPSLSASHLVQDSLEVLVSSARTLGFSIERPSDAEDIFETVRQRLAEVARSQFEEGYHSALEASTSLGLWSIELLATTHRWDTAKWAKSYASAAVMVDMKQLEKEYGPDRELIAALGRALGDYMSPYFDDSFSPGTAYLRGFTQAMRDLWGAVYEGVATYSGESRSGANRARQPEEENQ